MDNIITVEEFIAFRNVSKKVDAEKINECISLAQKSDLNNILGDFFFDVYKNRNNPDYEGLLNGLEFEYCDEVFIHDGVKSLLADYTYSRFMYMINVNMTPFGAVAKETQDSKAIDRNHIKDLSKQAQIDASNKFNIIQKYILSKPELFSRYCSNDKNRTGFNGIKIKKL